VQCAPNADVPASVAQRNNPTHLSTSAASCPHKRIDERNAGLGILILEILEGCHKFQREDP
jgi:hypothetical protein